MSSSPYQCRSLKPIGSQSFTKNASRDSLPCILNCSYTSSWDASGQVIFIWGISLVGAQSTGLCQCRTEPSPISQPHSLLVQWSQALHPLLPMSFIWASEGQSHHPITGWNNLDPNPHWEVTFPLFGFCIGLSRWAMRSIAHVSWSHSFRGQHTWEQAPMQWSESDSKWQPPVLRPLYSVYVWFISGYPIIPWFVVGGVFSEGMRNFCLCFHSCFIPDQVSPDQLWPFLLRKLTRD